MPAMRQAVVRGTNKWSRDSDNTKTYVCIRCGGTRPFHQTTKIPRPRLCRDCRSDPLYRDYGRTSKKDTTA